MKTFHQIINKSEATNKETNNQNQEKSLKNERIMIKSKLTSQ